MKVGVSVSDFIVATNAIVGDISDERSDAAIAIGDLDGAATFIDNE